MIIAAVLAGGSGTRMGTSVPKQFLEIGGEPVIIRSIKAFLKNSEVDKCIVSVSSDYLKFTEELISEFIDSPKDIFVIEGGKTRGDTLFGVLAFMKENDMLTGSIVLTHDAVRPFITDRIINDNIEAAKKYGACNTCVRAVDTVLLSENGEYIDFVPDRNTVFHAQTPQSFDAEKLFALIKNTPKEIFDALTDGCSVFTYHKENVYIVQGENYNIKITYPDDIGRAENIIKQYFN
ncbi:MAG: 2-C-methyl-D-erythritol 4-phosphate cytidylyltransferase [Clostridia bacterium]|nr:2-C-methyl-D-erythritol 4-phosphate cytidylyltransferase [Clostridia bacterium]